MLAGNIRLGEAELAAYISALHLNYAVDEVFIVCWVLSWVALCLLLREENRSLLVFLLTIGLLGPLFDLIENGLVWKMVALLAHGEGGDLHLLGTWQAVRHLSYVVPFAAGVLLLLALYARGALGGIVVAAAALITAVATLGLYLPALEIASYLWWLLFFLLAAYLQWASGDSASGVSALSALE